MDKPVFTVVIPTYNRGDTINRAIESVLAQDFQSFELLVVDDGSTDQTGDVVKAFADSRVHYTKQENRERAAARNRGILSARGEFVTFLDSDDVFMTNHLSTAKRFASSSNADVFHIGYNIVTDDGKLVQAWTPLQNPVNEKLLDGNYLSCLGVFIKVSIARNNLFNEDRALSGSEDYELWLRLASRYEIQAVGTATALLIHHRRRSVLGTDSKGLITRIDLLRQYIFRDESIVRKFGQRLVKWDAWLDVYVALHLAIMGKNGIRSLLFLSKAVSKSPVTVLSRRFWAVLKNILIRRP